MKYEPINLKSKFDLFSEHWSPKIIAQMNDYHFKLVKIQDDFVWHSHAEADEVFLVMEGSMKISFRDGQVNLSSGEVFVVPKGIEHEPYAEKECRLMLIEPVGTVNTGETGAEMTAKSDAWI